MRSVIITSGRGAAPTVFWGTTGARGGAPAPSSSGVQALIPMGDWCASRDTEPPKTEARKRNDAEHRGSYPNARTRLRTKGRIYCLAPGAANGCTGGGEWVTPSKRGRKPAERNPLSAKVHELEAKVARLEKELHTAHTILDVQGKVAGLLGFSLEHGKDC